MNLKNKLRNQMIILTILSFFIFLFFFLRINVYTYTPIFRIIYTIVFISIILIQWIMYFSQNKKNTSYSWLVRKLSCQTSRYSTFAIFILRYNIRSKTYLRLISLLFLFKYHGYCFFLLYYYAYYLWSAYKYDLLVVYSLFVDNCICICIHLYAYWKNILSVLFIPWL